MNTNTVNEGKTAAIISYLWWIGLLIAFIMNNDKRNPFTSFHIRQALGIALISFFLGILVLFGFGFALFANFIFLGLFVLWVIGLLSAINGEKKSIPLFGDLFQDWFKNI